MLSYGAWRTSQIRAPLNSNRRRIQVRNGILSQRRFHRDSQTMSIKMTRHRHLERTNEPDKQYGSGRRAGHDHANLSGVGEPCLTNVKSIVRPAHLKH